MGILCVRVFLGFFCGIFKDCQIDTCTKDKPYSFISVSFSRANPKLTTDPDALGINWEFIHQFLDEMLSRPNCDLCSLMLSQHLFNFLIDTLAKYSTSSPPLFMCLRYKQSNW